MHAYICVYSGGWGKGSDLINLAAGVSIPRWTLTYFPSFQNSVEEQTPSFCSPWAQKTRAYLVQAAQLYMCAVVQVVKRSACQLRRLKRLGFEPWVRKIPWRRIQQPIPAFLPGESHEQRAWKVTVHRVQNVRHNGSNLHTHINLI